MTPEEWSQWPIQSGWSPATFLFLSDPRAEWGILETLPPRLWWALQVIHATASPSSTFASFVIGWKCQILSQLFLELGMSLWPSSSWKETYWGLLLLDKWGLHKEESPFFPQLLISCLECWSCRDYHLTLGATAAFLPPWGEKSLTSWSWQGGIWEESDPW